MMLTVGKLKERLNQIPDELNDMPVAYQRIEDLYFTKYGWATEKLVWENIDIQHEDGGKTYEKIYSEYILAFSAYKHPDANIFVIDAHY